MDQDIISLYEVDFRRIRGIGKEESKTRNLKVLWQPVFDDYFRISFDSSMVFDQREGKAYIGNIDFQRFSSVLKDTIVDFDYFKDLLRTKIHLSNEIRKTKIEYYKYASWKAGAIANKIRNVIGEDCLCSFRCPDAKN